MDAYLEGEDVGGALGPEGALLQPRLRGEATGSGELRRCDDIAAVGLLHRGDGVERRRHPDAHAHSNPDAHRSPRVPAALQAAPGA